MEGGHFCPTKKQQPMGAERGTNMCGSWQRVNYETQDRFLAPFVSFWGWDKYPDHIRASAPPHQPMLIGRQYRLEDIFQRQTHWRSVVSNCLTSLQQNDRIYISVKSQTWLSRDNEVVSLVTGSHSTWLSKTSIASKTINTQMALAGHLSVTISSKRWTEILTLVHNGTDTHCAS